MPNALIALREEMSRVAKKEIKRLVEPLRKLAQLQRREIAALKKDRTALQADIKRLQKSAPRKAGPAPIEPDATAGDGRKTRFSGAQCRALRKRLDISQETLGKLVGVSGPSVFSWEADKTRPKAVTMARITALRALSRKQVDERVAELKSARKGASSAAHSPKRAKKAAKRKAVAKGATGKKSTKVRTKPRKVAR